MDWIVWVIILAVFAAIIITVIALVVWALLRVARRRHPNPWRTEKDRRP